MAVFTYKDVYVSLGGTEISDHVKSVTLNQSIETIDQTAMGDSTRTFRKGLDGWTAEFEFHQDFAASEFDAIWAVATDNLLAVELRPANTTVSATNPKYTGTGLVTSYSPLGGTVGDGAMAPVSIVANTSLTRAES